MPKRKRDDDESTADDEITDQALRIRVSRLKAKVDQGDKNIASALKLARGFERQKLGRRQKSAQNEPKQLLRLREEVILLKSLDLVDTAKKYLFKQLVKTKRIKESPAFVKIYGEEPEVEGPKAGVEANVVGRLFNSNPVKEILPGIMSGIYGCLGIDEKRSAAEGKGSKESADKTNGNPRVDDEFEGFSDDGLGSDPNIESNGGVVKEQSTDSEEDEALALYDDRLASSDDSMDVESEDGYEDFESRKKGSNGQDHDRRHLDNSISSTDAGFTSDSDQLSRTPPPVLRSTKAVPAKPSSTAFLPSLSHGGYYSGSESNDDEADQRYNNSSGIPQVRNNRRGQRARQKIAEKKYGQNAKHLLKQGKQASGRDTGWDAQRGATDGKPKKGRLAAGGGRGFSVRERGPTGANADAIQSKASKAKGDGPLHPSWEAAKKRKEGQKPSLAFAGKKITFD